jgi:two-component system phosphate regulon sensor histidine kinase PhoR
LQYNQPEEKNANKSIKEDLYLLSDNGEKTILSVKTGPIIIKNQRLGSIITFHDITEDRQLEEMKIDFVSMAAHELRTPLTAIRGYTSILQMQNITQLDNSGKEMLDRLAISSENLGNLIDNLLSVSRIERNAFTVALKPLNAAAIFKNVIDTSKQQVETKNQKLIVNIQKDLPVIMADDFRITQVILNLVANASNYTKEGGTITLNASVQNGQLQTSVEDTGQGIPKEAIPKLFTKFFRVSGELEQGSKGTGLGLFISKSIIDMHKGEIWVQSELGKGTKFTFTLPCATEEEVQNYQQSHDKRGLILKSNHGIINS